MNDKNASILFCVLFFLALVWGGDNAAKLREQELVNGVLIEVLEPTDQQLNEVYETVDGLINRE